jgi:16S rRNA (guanine966-N2)-methyltransferase
MDNPRIISGIYKGHTLEVPTSARPITDRVKRSMMDTLTDVLTDSKVVDLFAGSGNIGFEALSRGASHATFVENNDKAAGLIKNNAINLGVEKDKFKVIPKPYSSFCKNSEEIFDLIFIDPPFKIQNEVNFELIKPLMNEDSIAVIKLDTAQSDEIKFSDSFETVLEKIIGSNKLVYLKIAKVE